MKTGHGFLAGIAALPKNARTFVGMQILFSGVSAILSLFINTFLLNAYGSFSPEVLLYNAVLALVQPGAMFTALAVARRGGVLVVQRIGFVFYVLALTVLSVFGSKVSAFYPLFAAALSFAAGYYFSAYSAQVLSYTEDGNRDLISGITAMVGAVISVSLPLLSGWLIVAFDEGTGYRIVFGIAAVLALGAYLTTLRLPKIPASGRAGAFRRTWRTLLGDRNGRLIMTANALSNCCSNTVPIFVTLLFYNLMPNEFLIGVSSTIGHGVQFLGALLYGQLVTSRNRTAYSVAAAVLVSLTCQGMLFGLNIYMIIIFQAVFGLATSFMATPVLNTHFKVAESLGLHGEAGAEVHLVREFFVAAGRILGLALVWFVPRTNAGAVIVLVLLMATAVANAGILRRIDRNGLSGNEPGNPAEKEAFI